MRLRHVFLIVMSLVLILAGCSNNDVSGENENENDQTEKKDLVISIWGFNEDLLRENVFEPFEKEHNVNIILEVGNNADRLNKVRLGSSNVDLIYLADSFAQQGIEEGLFEEIDREKIPNIENIYEVAQEPMGPYGPAYTIGSFGIVYDPEKVDVTIDSWEDLWDENLSKQVALAEITTTSGPAQVDFASKVGGSETLDADKGFEKLQELRPNILMFYRSSSDLVNMFAQGEVSVATVSDFAFGSIKEAVPSAEWVIPKEGAYAYMNTINIVKGSENKELAEKFINWLLSEEVQRANALDKVDSPVNMNVELTEEEASGLTYGADAIESLNVLDWTYINQELPNWTDRWNREIVE